MDRRTFLALLGTPVLVGLLEACGDDEAQEATVISSSATRIAADPALAVDGAAVANGIGHDLFRWLAYEQPTANIVCSPVSIAFALAMTTAGAGGATRDELLHALHSVEPATLHRSVNALSAALDARASADVALALANSIWGQDGTTFEKPFLDLLAAEYGAGMHAVDYRDDTEGARRTINRWVEERTNERIPELLAKDVLTRDTRLTLVNAVHVKAPWATPFAEGATEERPFTTKTGETVEVPTMALTATLPYSTGDGWVAVELPFAGEQLAMVILLPEVGYGDIEQYFTINESVDYFALTLVNLRLPRFDIGAALALRPTLERLGVVTAFSDDADFTGISTDEPLHISAVAHQANITVDELGAEAAAATAVVVDAVSAPIDEPVEIVVDRPFVFAIRDRPSGAMVFLGRVADPRSDS